MYPHCTFCEKKETRGGRLERNPLSFGEDDGILLYMREGQLLLRMEKMREDGSDHVLRMGNTAWLRTGYDCYLCAEETVSYYEIRFKGEPPADFPPFFTPFDPIRIIELIYLLDDTIKRFYPDDVSDAILYALLGELYVQYSSNGRAAAPLYFRICEYLNENSDRELTIREIAEHFRYNSQYISRFFRRFDPAGIRSYLITARINHIKLLLLTTDLTLKEIAGMLGFRDYKLFLKYYTYHEKMSPTEFRAVFAQKKKRN